MRKTSLALLTFSIAVCLFGATVHGMDPNPYEHQDFLKTTEKDRMPAPIPYDSKNVNPDECIYFGALSPQYLLSTYPILFNHNFFSKLEREIILEKIAKKQIKIDTFGTLCTRMKLLRDENFLAKQAHDRIEEFERETDELKKSILSSGE